MKMAAFLLFGLLLAFHSDNYTTSETGNVFDGKQIKEGDTVAGMKVIRLNTTVMDGEVIGTVQFEGEATISGTYAYIKDHAFLEEGIMFRVDESSRKKLPKMKNDPREVWFVFDNFDEAKTMLGADSENEKATIVIDRYFINYQGKEVYNTARLVRVIEKN